MPLNARIAKREPEAELLVDGSNGKQEDVQRFILDHLLYFFPGPYAMLMAYLDESGSHTGSPVMCVAGLLYERGKMRRLDREWKRALQEAGVEEWHTVDQATSNKDQLYRQLIGIINRNACGGAVVFIPSKDQFDEFRRGKWDYGQYATCAHFCMLKLSEIAAKLHHKKVAFVIESGHEDLADLIKLDKELATLGYKRDCQYNGTKSIRPLQTADIWAYEVGKRFRDQFGDSPTRVRKSLKAIVEGIENLEVLALGRSELEWLFDQKNKIRNS